MAKYHVRFSCNPDHISLPAAQSERVISADRWEDIPAKCAEARNARVEDVTIVRLYLMP